MRVPLIDLSAQYQTIRTEVDNAIAEVLASCQFILGPNVEMLEREISAYLGVKHAVGVGSGTDALLLVLKAYGIGPGDEVIVPAYTFFATVEAVMLVGATPVLVDVEENTCCLKVHEVVSKITACTKAVIPVHLYGYPANMGKLMDVARSHKLKVIEDNAQAFGAEWSGRKTGGIGDVGCLSFFPSKNLGGYGDGGMLVTDDEYVCQRVRMLRTHGWKKKYFPEVPGHNSRLDELQAAVLRVKLRYVDEWNERRRVLAQQYQERLSPLGVITPRECLGGKHVYHLYVIRVEGRDRVIGRLRADGIGSGVYYPLPLHLTEACRGLGYQEGSFPVAEQLCRDSLAIPLFPEMTADQVQQVVAALGDALGEGR